MPLVAVIIAVPTSFAVTMPPTTAAMLASEDTHVRPVEPSDLLSLVKAVAVNVEVAPEPSERGVVGEISTLETELSTGAVGVLAPSPPPPLHAETKRPSPTRTRHREVLDCAGILRSNWHLTAGENNSAALYCRRAERQQSASARSSFRKAMVASVVRQRCEPIQATLFPYEQVGTGLSTSRSDASKYKSNRDSADGDLSTTIVPPELCPWVPPRSLKGELLTPHL